MSSHLQIHNAVEQSLSRLVYAKEEELKRQRQNILQQLSDSSKNENSANSKNDIDDDEYDENFERNHHQQQSNLHQNLLRSKLRNATHPCICSPLAWWTHRAMKTFNNPKNVHQQTIDKECTQIMALCLHILSHHQSASTSDDTENSKTNLISILIGNDELYNVLMKRINDGGFYNQFFRNPLDVKIFKLSDEENFTVSAAASKSFCKIFAFGYFPSPDINKKLFDLQSKIAAHLINSTDYSFLIGHCLWPECDGPLQQPLERAAKNLRDEPVCVTNRIISSTSSVEDEAVVEKHEIDKKTATCFSSCLVLRCSRHPEQVCVLTSALESLEHMRAAIRCPRLCRQPLRCGQDNHLCTENCHGFVEHESIQCPFPCTKKTGSCNHPCRKLCGEIPCDCLLKTKRDLDCSHVTLKGHRMHHRFEGACRRSHESCRVAVPVRCPHCFGVSFIPCHEVQEANLLSGVVVVDDAATSSPSSTTDLPLMHAATFQCKECQDTELKIRSQIKLELTKEVQQQQLQNKKVQQKTLADQAKAATRGIFLTGQQVVIRCIDKILDYELASNLFPHEVPDHKWTRIAANDDEEITNNKNSNNDDQDDESTQSFVSKSTFEDAIGVVTYRKADPTDATIVLYVLSVPTHRNATIAVADTGLELVRGVFGAAENEGGNALLMIEAKKKAGAMTATGGPNNNNNNNNNNVVLDESERRKEVEEKFPVGTRVLVVEGDLIVIDETGKKLVQDENLLFALDHNHVRKLIGNLHTPNRENENNEKTTKEESSSSSMNEDDADEIYNNNNNHVSPSASPLMKQTQQVTASPLASSIKMTNVVGTISKITHIDKNDLSGEQQQQQLQQDYSTAASYLLEEKDVANSSSQAWSKLVVSIEINIIHTNNSNNQSSTGAPQRRDRADETEEIKKSNNISSSTSEFVTIDVECDVNNVVPLFSVSSTVTVREPTRHVSDPQERSFFAIHPHQVIGLPNLQDLLFLQQQQKTNQQSIISSSMMSSPATNIPFSRRTLKENEKCVIQGFCNSPKATPPALQKDTNLRSALRRGPCYIISIFDETRKIMFSNKNNNNNNNNNNNAPMFPRLFLVPLFFADLGMEEIVDKNIASKLQQELDSRTKEKLDLILDERFISNQEVAEKRNKEIEEEKSREAKMLNHNNAKNAKNNNNNNTSQDEDANNNNNNEDAVAAAASIFSKQFATVHLFDDEKNVALSTQKFMAAKKWALGTYTGLLQMDAVKMNAGGSVGVVPGGVIKQMGDVFAKETKIDEAAVRGMSKMLY